MLGDLKSGFEGGTARPKIRFREGSVYVKIFTPSAEMASPYVLMEDRV